MSSLGCGYDNEKKNLVISFSLMMRLMEFAKEDAKDDIALHQVMEKLMAFNDGHNPLTIDVYDCLVADATGSSLPDKEEEDSDEESEGKVDRDFADYMQNIHDSYYEGGITGDDAKDCIYNYCQDESMDNCYPEHCCHEAAPIDYEAMAAHEEAMKHCCHEAPQIDYTDIDCYRPSFGNECPMQQADYHCCPEDDLTDYNIAYDENPEVDNLAQYDEKPTTITMSCVNDDEQPCEVSELPPEVEQEMMKVIKLANG